MRKWEIKYMKKCITLVLLAVVCLTTVSATVSATPVDHEGNVIVNPITLNKKNITRINCEVGDEFTVNVPTGWGIKSKCDLFNDDIVEIVSKDEGIFSDDYVIRIVHAGERGLVFVVGPPESLDNYSSDVFSLHIITDDF